MKITRIDYTALFIKQLKKAPVAIKKAFRDRYELFIADPIHPLLRNHLLTGKLKSRRSINITGDWRAVYSEVENKDGIIVIFELLGTHSQLYR